MAGQPSAWRELIDDVERQLLGLSAEPLDRRLESAHWRADAFDTFCHRCGRDAGVFEVWREGCTRCRGLAMPWDKVVRLGRYEGVLRDVVHEVKFTAFRSLGTAVGRLLGQRVASAIARRSPSEPPIQRVLVVPVPTSTRRRLARGIDHTRVLARAAAAALRRGTPDCPPVPARVWPVLSREHRPSQLAVPAGERLRNVAGAFRPAWRAGLARWSPAGWLAPAITPGTLVVLLDDVTTTGATARAAARALRSVLKPAGGKDRRAPAGARVEGSGAEKKAEMWLVILAVTPDRREGGAGVEVEV
jgi:predicted amidophosphoribosyltransferase